MRCRVRQVARMDREAPRDLGLIDEKPAMDDIEVLVGEESHRTASSTALALLGAAR